MPHFQASTIRVWQKPYLICCAVDTKSVPHLTFRVKLASFGSFHRTGTGSRECGSDSGPSTKYHHSSSGTLGILSVQPLALQVEVFQLRSTQKPCLTTFVPDGATAWHKEHIAD